MNKLVVLCRLDNCYYNNDEYNYRKNFISKFVNQIQLLKDMYDVHEVLFSFFSNNITYEKGYISVTELSMNQKEKIVKMGEQFYKDKKIYTIGNEFVIEKSSDNVYKDILEYIKINSKNDTIKRILYIDNIDELKLKNNCDTIVTCGLENIVNSLDQYLSKNLSELPHIYKNCG